MKNSIALTATIGLWFAVAVCGRSQGQPVRFGDLPTGWKVTSNSAVAANQAAAIGTRLGGRVEELTNTVLLADGSRLQVNVIRCATSADADKIHEAILAAHGGNADCSLRSGNNVVEFVCDDLRVVKKAHYALGLRSRAVVYRITFDAAPIEQADYMSWNELYTLFLTLADDPQDRQTLADIAELRGRFRFGHDLSFRTRGLAAQPNTYTFAPLPLTRDAADSGDALSYSFGELPTRADIPYVSVTATVRSEAFAVVPCRRPPGKELVAPTPFWPVGDSDVATLASKITSGCNTNEEKVAAILEWLIPGRNIRFAGSVTGSRYGVKPTLRQGFGHCWDFSDLFVTLARSAGVPSRQVAGWLHERCGHVWAEVLLDGQGWQQVDPTAGMACGSDYIPYLTSDSGDMPIVYLSAPRIEVLRQE